jgi:hypothetical protein
LVIFDCFWDFDNLLKMERNRKRKSWKLDLFLGPFWVLGDNVMGKGCRPMGLPMLRTTVVYINGCIGEVSEGEGRRVVECNLCD